VKSFFVKLRFRL